MGTFYSLAFVPLALILRFGNPLNICLLLALSVFRKWNIIQDLAHTYINPTIVITTPAGLISLFISFQVLRYILSLTQTSSHYSEDGFPVKPMFFPCRTSHVRMFPKKHGFSYSYLLVGIPVGWRGSVGGMLSADTEKEQTSWYVKLLPLRPGGAWFTVNGDDYLGRGHVEGGLQGKLKNYLEGEGIDPEQYSYAYLLTSARFLGYFNNPVSIWNLYSSTKELKAVILEVNNTFGERHPYFLSPSSTTSPSKDGSLSKPPRYTGTWPKDFYVSVFNDRSGSYSVAAYDPLFPFMSGTGPINTTITLSDSNSKAMLIARVYSAGDALDPTSMSILAKTRFLLGWWWVGLATFPRSVREAITLLFRRGMKCVFRPEPRKDTMPRPADATEQCIESAFRAYLQHVVSHSQETLILRYVSAGLVSSSPKEHIMASPSAQLLPESSAKEVEIRVLTPLFYSRLVQYPPASTSNSLLPALLSEHHINSTITISNPDILSTFDFTSTEAKDLNTITKLSLQLLSTLRSSSEPTPIPRLPKESPPPPSTLPRSSATDPSHEPGQTSHSALDLHALANVSPAAQKEYVNKVATLLLAGRIAHGWMEILDFEILLVRVAVIWGVVRLLV